MTCLLDPTYRMTHLVMTMMGMLAIWLFTSCDATNRHVAAPHALATPTTSPAKRFAPYELLIKFTGEASQERIASIMQKNQLDVIAEIQRGRLYHVRILDDRPVESVIAQLTSYPEIKYAEPNFRYETQK